LTVKKIIDSGSLTFIVQGSVDDKCVVDSSLKSIRHFFPKSKIVLSTWKKTNVKSLAFDELVLSEDKCITYKFYKHLSIDNNVNRQLVSTQNGLKKVKTKYAIKLRNDIVFKSNNLLKILGSIQKKSGAGLLSSRIIIPYDLSINPNNVKLLFHLNDWFVAGETNDLKKIFNIPLMNIFDLTYFKNITSKKCIFTLKNWRDNNVKLAELSVNIISRYTPEQYIYKYIILRNTSLKFDNLFTFNSKLLKAHHKFAEKEILFRSSKDIGFFNLKHKQKLSSDRVGYYTKIQCASIPTQLRIFLESIDLEKYFFKVIQLIKILLIKLSPRLYIKIKELV